MGVVDSTLPHWDLTVVYPDIASEAFEAAYADVVARVEDLEATFDQYGISRHVERANDYDAIACLEEIVPRLNELTERARTIYAYLFGHIATDSRDERAQAKWSEFQQLRVRLSLIETHFTAWVGALDVEELVAHSPMAQAHAYVLHRARERAAHQLPLAQEALVAELDIVAGKAWGKLHGTFTSQLMVTVEIEGEVRELPMSAARNLASSPDREVRRQAYEAELAAWKRAEVPIAAAMNGIKGQVQLLARQRGWDSALHESLFSSNIDRTVLDAMMGAASDSFPDFRRYLRAKARALGLSTLAWYDLFAPVGTADSEWRFDVALTTTTLTRSACSLGWGCTRGTRPIRRRSGRAMTSCCPRRGCSNLPS